MAKAVTLGNGKLLVGLDAHAQVQDFYFPYVGLENHMHSMQAHRIGVYVDGTLVWLSDPTWTVTSNCDVNTSAGEAVATNADYELRLRINSVVYNEQNIFVRSVIVENTRAEPRDITVYFAQQFYISQTHWGDTAYYDPRCNAVIHYKGKRAFLVNGRCDNQPFQQYSIGLFGIEGKEGTFRDAEDGDLSGNPIEHGTVDSVIGFELRVAANAESAPIYYWIAAGYDIEEVHERNAYTLRKGPQHLMQTSRDYWHAWVNRQQFEFYGLSDNVVSLFKKSLFFMRMHADNDGAIIASSDSDLLQHGRDTYAYMWPRDGALTAIALDRVGDTQQARAFFLFCRDALSSGGYLMHKFQPDGSLGSSWHPWVRDGEMALPIQEDETAIVVYALWRHYQMTRDLEFIELLYNSLLTPAAEFLAHHIDDKTGLPKPSYDLWEEQYGISMYTCATVYAALSAAAEMAETLGKTQQARRYHDVAQRIRHASVETLYNRDRGMFYKMAYPNPDGSVSCDETLDMSSFYGAFAFGVLSVDDTRMQRAAAVIQQQLQIDTDVGGIPRYETDAYARVSDSAPSNPWFITSMWLAQYHVRIAESESDLEPVKEWLEWAARYARNSGVLSEQIHPYTGEQLNVAPLTWSHAEYVTTVIDYLQKLEELGICKTCYPLDPDPLMSA